MHHAPKGVEQDVEWSFELKHEAGVPAGCERVLVRNVRQADHVPYEPYEAFDLVAGWIGATLDAEEAAAERLVLERATHTLLLSTRDPPDGEDLSHGLLRFTAHALQLLGKREHPPAQVVPVVEVDGEEVPDATELVGLHHGAAAEFHGACRRRELLPPEPRQPQVQVLHDAGRGAPAHREHPQRRPGGVRGDAGHVARALLVEDHVREPVVVQVVEEERADLVV